MDYAVKVTVKNNRILQRMRAAGYESQAELARAAHTSLNDVCALIGLRKPPILKNGEWSNVALSVAAALRCDPADMFTERQLRMCLPTNSATVEMGEPAVMRLTSGGDMERAAWAKIEVAKLMGCLNPREVEVVSERMQGATYEDLAAERRVRRERIRQIEAKAIRKMRARASVTNKAFAREIVFGGNNGQA